MPSVLYSQTISDRCMVLALHAPRMDSLPLIKVVMLVCSAGGGGAGVLPGRFRRPCARPRAGELGLGPWGRRAAPKAKPPDHVRLHSGNRNKSREAEISQSELSLSNL
eukprot:7078575-Prymnesium_polylepis.2